MYVSSNSRRVVFIAIMAALGNVMFVVSRTIFATNQIALDLSHIGTLIAAVYGGPWVGFLAGLLVGVGPGLYFGYIGGSLGLLGVVGLPIGKALMGASVGYISSLLRRRIGEHQSLMTAFAVLIGYLPECIYTIFYFETLVVILLPTVAEFFIAIFGSLHLLVLSILTKAWIEIALLAIFMSALVGNQGFNSFMNRIFTSSEIKSKPETDK
jgi:thiamine transporter ThiT